MRLRAPRENGATLSVPELPLVPDAIRANQRLFQSASLRIAGIPLQELRQNARRQFLDAPDDVPLLITGHQPELGHPGVWTKNFALNRLAKRVQGIPLNLIVNHDTMKSDAIALPTWHKWQAHCVRRTSVSFDDFNKPEPYETRQIANKNCFASFADRVLVQTANWGFTPMICQAWQQALALPAGTSIGERFTHMRVHQERAWGCENIQYRVSDLSRTEAFQLFAQDIIVNAERFRACYNAAVREYRKRHKLTSQSHPVPELAEGELPFWSIAGHKRKPTMRHDERTNLRPRALTLTLFVRLCLADYFIHGLGGGKYDEVTDTIIANYYGMQPPAFQILTGTLLLPLPSFSATPNSVRAGKLAQRNRKWNPESFTDVPHEAVEEKRYWIAQQPGTRHERRARYRKLKELNAVLEPHVRGEQEAASILLEQGEAEVKANAILQRRDSAWLLYPEDELREFL